MATASNSQRVFMLTVITALVIVALSHGQSILMPLVVGMFVAYLLIAFASWLQAQTRPLFAMPSWLAFLIAAGFAALVLWQVIQLVAANLAAVVAAAPTYQANLERILASVGESFGMEHIPALSDVRRLSPEISLQRLITFAATSIRSLAGNAIIIGVYALFLVLERGAITKKILLMSKSREDRQRISETLRDIGDRTRTYVFLKTAMSLLVAIVSWLVMFLIGIDFAGFWAVLVFVLNFIPYIGSAIAVLFPVALTLVQFESVGLFIFAALSLSGVQFVVGSIIEPRVMGQSLNLSPVVILLSLALWGSIWGVVGAILSVPLMVIITIVMSRFEATRPIAILLSRDGTLD